MRICWFTTGRDKEALLLLKDVSDTIERKEIQGEISVIFMNRDRHESDMSDEIIVFAEKMGIPVELLSSKRFLEERGIEISEGRALFDAQV